MIRPSRPQHIQRPARVNFAVRTGSALLPLAWMLSACGQDVTVGSDSAATTVSSAAVMPEAAHSLGGMGGRSADAANGASNRAANGAATDMMTRPAAAPAPAPPPQTPGISAASVPQATVSTLTATAAAPTAPAMVIRNGSANIQVDSLARAIDAVRRITTSLGGFVGNTSVAQGDDQVRRATLELKIPVSRFDDAVSGLSPVGKVESVDAVAQDVGEEFTDLTARIANARRLESRLITLLAERAGKLQDALMVERELARVREEIERYEGRARYLSARVAMSTLTVNLHEPLPLVSANPGESVLLEAAKDAWRNLVRTLALLIEALGVLLPLGGIAAVAYAVYRRRRVSSAA